MLVFPILLLLSSSFALSEGCTKMFGGGGGHHNYVEPMNVIAPQVPVYTGQQPCSQASQQPGPGVCAVVFQGRACGGGWAQPLMQGFHDLVAAGKDGVSSAIVRAGCRLQYGSTIIVDAVGKQVNVAQNVDRLASVTCTCGRFQ